MDGPYSVEMFPCELGVLEIGFIHGERDKDVLVFSTTSETRSCLENGISMAEKVMDRASARNGTTSEFRGILSLDVLLPPILWCAAIARDPAVLDKPAAVALHELRVVSTLLEELRRLFYALVLDVRIDQPTARLVAVNVDNHIRHKRVDGAFVNFARLLARHAVDLFDLVTAREHHVIDVEDAVFGIVPGHFLASRLTQVGIVSNHHVLDPNLVEQSLVGNGLVLGKARARQQKQQNGGGANDAVTRNACLHDISLMLEVRRSFL